MPHPPFREIEEHVWRLDDYVVGTTINVYIHSLRKKLGDSDEAPLIQTVRGYGYRLNRPA